MPFSTLILDADGVINQGKLLSLEEDFGIPSERMARFFREAFADCLIGKADLRERLLPYLDEWGWKGTVDELLAYWFKQGHAVHEQVRDVVVRLRSAGIPVHLATNQERHRVQYMRDAMGYGDLFVDIHASSELGHLKPSQEFFCATHERIAERDPANILFWDDMQKNVDAARQYGFAAELFQSEEDFVERMKMHFPGMV